MKKVIVLFGGDSDEKEISKLSADSIINNIDTTKFDACLLYTSPSPRDRQKSRMPSSA